jgi:hypothetical protein
MTTYKTINEAIEAAKNPTEANNGQKNAYEISIELAETAKNLVGKTLSKDGKSMKIEKWVNQNYVVSANGIYMISPVMYTIQMSKNFEIN